MDDKQFDALCEANSFGAVARGEFPLVPRALLKGLVDASVAAERERCAKLCETWMTEAERHSGPEAAGWLHQVAQHMRNNHGHARTGSNDTGQLGSAYGRNLCAACVTPTVCTRDQRCLIVCA